MTVTLARAGVGPVAWNGRRQRAELLSGRTTTSAPENAPAMTLPRSSLCWSSAFPSPSVERNAVSMPRQPAGGDGDIQVIADQTHTPAVSTAAIDQARVVMATRPTTVAPSPHQPQPGKGAGGRECGCAQPTMPKRWDRHRHGNGEVSVRHVGEDGRSMALHGHRRRRSTRRARAICRPSSMSRRRRRRPAAGPREAARKYPAATPAAAKRCEAQDHSNGTAWPSAGRGRFRSNRPSRWRRKARSSAGVRERSGIARPGQARQSEKTGLPDRRNIEIHRTYRMMRWRNRWPGGTGRLTMALSGDLRRRPG